MFKNEYGNVEAECTTTRAVMVRYPITQSTLSVTERIPLLDSITGSSVIVIPMNGAKPVTCSSSVELTNVTLKIISTTSLLVP